MIIMFSVNPINSFNELIEILKLSDLSYDFDLIEKGFEFAKKIHEDKLRLSGETYVSHLLGVAGYTAQLKLDTTTILCSLLHDTVEKGGVDLNLIDREFGTEVAFIIDGLTTIQKLTKGFSDDKLDTENLKHLIFNATDDIRILIIRLCEKLHNLYKSDENLSYEIRFKSARKALNIYAPLAEYLGLAMIQRNLEDLAFKTINPEIYNLIGSVIEEETKSSKSIIDEFIIEASELLQKYNVESASISSRRKGIYSTYKKVKRKIEDSERKIEREDLLKLQDINAARIILNSVEDCYLVLGLIQSKWKFDPSSFDDYIAKPKPNGYRSIQIAIYFKDALFEVQIRTKEMHEYNEYGPASHIAYKLRGSKKGVGDSLTWTKDLLKWKGGLNKDDFKINAFANSIFVFTPKGLIIKLDKDSTPIDFAFRLHTQIGYRYAGAKINNKMVSMETKLQTGDVVEILTSKNINATLDWVRSAKMNETKSRIRRLLNKGI